MVHLRAAYALFAGRGRPLRLDDRQRNQPWLSRVRGQGAAGYQRAPGVNLESALEAQDAGYLGDKNALAQHLAAQ